MTTTVDHLVYACPDLSEAVREISDLTGVTGADGGQHLGLGTKNALLSLGSRTYLELIGPDPDQPKPAEPRPFSLDQLSSPSLRGWAAVPEDIGSAISKGRSTGHDFGEQTAGSRRTRDGGELRWMMTISEAAPAMTVLPFLIDREGSPHPAASAPGGLRLERLVLLTPVPGTVLRLVSVLGLEDTVEIEASPSPALRAELRGSGGTRLALVS